jgi:Ni/Fe-hydrogenase subunit HybB-like protein
MLRNWFVGRFAAGGLIVHAAGAVFAAGHGGGLLRVAVQRRITTA